MTKREKLIKRIERMTENNSIIVSLYPESAKDWEGKLNEIKKLESSDLEIEIIKMESKEIEMNDSELQKEEKEKADLATALSKLTAIGLTREDLLLIIKGT